MFTWPSSEPSWHFSSGTRVSTTRSRVGTPCNQCTGVYTCGRQVPHVVRTRFRDSLRLHTLTSLNWDLFREREKRGWTKWLVLSDHWGTPGRIYRPQVPLTYRSGAQTSVPSHFGPWLLCLFLFASICPSLSTFSFHSHVLLLLSPLCVTPFLSFRYSFLSLVNSSKTRTTPLTPFRPSLFLVFVFIKSISFPFLSSLSTCLLPLTVRIIGRHPWPRPPASVPLPQVDFGLLSHSRPSLHRPKCTSGV